MSDLARVRADARRAYEHGRGARALRVSLVIVPLAGLCARETDAPWRCGAVGIALLLAAILARWRQHGGVRSVDAGLLTGVIPMATALVLCRLAGSWPAGAALAVCTAAGFVAGGLAGRATMGSARLQSPHWVTASVVAGLTAALGCVGIGVGTAIGAAAAVVVGAVVAAEVPRRASA
jgi:hypothetical protein